MELQYLPQLTAFNKIIKEMDDIYHNYAKHCGLSDSAFWVLYSSWQNDKVSSQRELCAAWFYSPQTINSALKKLEKQGYVSLEPSPKKGMNKQISFTPAGKALIEKIIPPVIQAELNVFADLGENGRKELLSLTQKYAALMRGNLNRIMKDSSED